MNKRQCKFGIKVKSIANLDSDDPGIITQVKPNLCVTFSDGCCMSFSPRELVIDETTVEIVIMGGCVQSVIKPRGVTLNIRDYDVDGDYDGTETDDNGDHYQLMVFDTDEDVTI